MAEDPYRHDNSQLLLCTDQAYYITTPDTDTFTLADRFENRKQQQGTIHIYMSGNCSPAKSAQ